MYYRGMGYMVCSTLGVVGGVQYRGVLYGGVCYVVCSIVVWDMLCVVSRCGV